MSSPVAANQSVAHPMALLSDQMKFVTAMENVATAIRHQNYLNGFRKEDVVREPLNMLMLIVTELGEAADAFRNHNPDSDHLGATTSAAEEELADVFIRLVDFADEQKFDLAGAILRKMAFNATRPFMHGGKTC